MAGDDRPICHLRQSPLLHLFLALPRPSLGRDRRAPPVLGRSPGVRFSAMVHSSPGVGEASIVSPDPPHPHRLLLVSASMVRGPPPVVGGSSSDSFCAPRPPLPALVSSTLPGSPQAGPSCLETVQRFTRAAGFSSAVAAWRAVHHRAPTTSSSGRFTGHGAALRATPSHGPPSPRWRISSGGSARLGALVSHPSRAIDRCSQWCSSSISLPSLATRFFGTCCVPFGALLHPTRCVLLPGTS